MVLATCHITFLSDNNPTRLTLSHFMDEKTDSERGGDYQSDKAVCRNSLNSSKLRSAHVNFTSIFKSKKAGKKTTIARNTYV